MTGDRGHFTTDVPRQTLLAGRDSHPSTGGCDARLTATVRPARSDLPTANVLFQVYRRSGSSWVLAASVTKAINDSGVASLAWTFSTAGSWYVRAQAQPTSVNANSFWTMNSYVNVS